MKRLLAAWDEDVDTKIQSLSSERAKPFKQHKNIFSSDTAQIISSRRALWLIHGTSSVTLYGAGKRAIQGHANTSQFSLIRPHWACPSLLHHLPEGWFICTANLCSVISAALWLVENTAFDLSQLIAARFHYSNYSSVVRNYNYSQRWWCREMPLLRPSECNEKVI